MDTKTQDKNGYNEYETVKRSTYIPLIIFGFIVSIYTVIRICQVYLTPPDDTKYAIEALLGLLTLIVLIVQSGIIRMQWRAMQEGLERTDRLMEQSERFHHMTQRPILVVETAKAELKIDGTTIEPTVIIINKGNTAARNIRIFFQVSEPGPKFPFDGPYFESPFIAAKDTLTIHDERQSSRKKWSDLAKADAAMGFDPIYIYGVGSYEDLLGNSYPIDKWAFVWTTKHGWINDYFVFEAKDIWDTAIADLRAERNNAK